MNKIILMGRITSEPIARTTPSNHHVLSFSIAVPRRFAKEGQTQADFFNCTAWNGTAEFIQKWFGKGRMIAVAGRLQNRSWEDNGVKKYATDIVVEEAYFTGEKREDTQTAEQTVSRAVSDFYGFTDIDPADEEDLPF